MSATLTQTNGSLQSSRLHMTLPTHALIPLSGADSLPERLSNAFNALPKLTRQQCGHLRHFHNLSSQLDGDWAFMGSQEPGQEWDTALRYQIATMAYAAGAAHYHRLPAMRSIFKALLERLIAKMLHIEVWNYWYLTSQSGIRIDPDLKETRKPWADPVCKENIMYSGHLLLMVSLYSMLFHDHRYDKEGGIVFDWNPLFYGMGPERFGYTRSTLQATILKEMERENWMGVCCEPNMIFIICNQFPIIATRYNDVINSTNIVDDVLSKYKAAWAKKGMLSENGLFRGWYSPKQDRVVVADEISHSAWVMAFMPWNYKLIQSMYPSTGDGSLHRVDGRINLHSGAVTNAIKDIVAKEGGRCDSPDVIARARAMTANMKPTMKPYLSPAFGYVAQWLSEIAGPPDLDALLLHADTYLSPSWSKGGLYYARCDTGWDRDGNYTYVEPYTGNAAIGYARLNVKDGQKKMWDQPWTKADVESRPWIDGIAFEQNVDCLRGGWDEERQAMVATFRTWNEERVAVRPVAKMLPAGTYGLYINGELQRAAMVASPSEEIAIDLEVGGDGVDVVLLRA